MTAKQIAASLHGVRAGKRWMCRCPNSRLHAHGDRNRSLSIGEKDGWVTLKCFTGCEREEILAAMGLRLRDLALNDFVRNPEWEQRKTDQERLEILTKRWGLFAWLAVLEPAKRNYYRAAARNTLVEQRELWDKIHPVEAYYRRRNERVQTIISKYGFDELWNCLPVRVFQTRTL